MPSNLQIWEDCLQQMKDCRGIAELTDRFGGPKHRIQADGFEIWHYPLGIDSGLLYSIHVSVWRDQSHQAYMHLEPAIGDSMQHVGH